MDGCALIRISEGEMAEVEEEVIEIDLAELKKLKVSIRPEK